MHIRCGHHGLIALTGIVMPLVFATGAAAQSLPAIAQEAPGPLEQQANILAFDGPLPARLVDPMPVYPGTAMGTGAAGMLTVRLTIDATGAVAEARYAGYDRLALRTVNDVLEAAPMLDETFVESALQAVRVWRYAPPATAPIAAYVEFGFGPKGTVRVLWHDSKRRGSGIVKSPAPQVSAPTACIPRVEPLPLDNVVIVGENIPPPRQLKSASPIYPTKAQALGVEGTVVIQLIIDERGLVTDARAVGCQSPLEQAAIDAIRQWEFEPTAVEGNPVMVAMMVAVSFSLR